MKKKVIIGGIVVIVLALLLTPKTMHLKDGGTVEHKALIYKVSNVHRLVDDLGYEDGLIIEILGKEVYNSVKPSKKEELKNNKEEIPNFTTQNDNSFVATVLEETTTYMIVEPNEDEVERKSADKIRINFGTEHVDYLYGVGRKVIIQYTGYIKETYPAQIDSDDILINGYEDFKLEVEEANNKRVTKILNNKELDSKYNSDYDLYYYGIDKVKITIADKTMLLEEALRSGKMTIDGLVIKANKDFPNLISYDDGGSMEYHYDNYTIIKMHKIDGNRDVYIGTKDMTINDI